MGTASSARVRGWPTAALALAPKALIEGPLAPTAGSSMR